MKKRERKYILLRMMQAKKLSSLFVLVPGDPVTQPTYISFPGLRREWGRREIFARESILAKVVLDSTVQWKMISAWV